MKKRIGIAFIILLTLALTPGCSKKGAKDEAPAAASKTVDLGEVDDSAAGDEAKNDAKGAKADKDSAKGDKDSANADKAGKAEKDEKDGTKAGKDGIKADKAADDKAGNEAGAKAPEAGDAPEPSQPNPKKADDKANAEAGDALGDSDEAQNDEMNFDEPEPLPEVRRPKPRVGLDIEKLINIRELREQTGYSGALSDAWLLGQNPDERYNAMRLATDNAKDLGFAIQVWKPGNESAASKRFGDLYAQSFGGKKLKALATDAFTASHHDVHELGFYDRSKRATVLLSCSSKVCTLAQLQSIALTIQRRL